VRSAGNFPLPPASDPSASAARPACVLQELRVENLLLIEQAQLRLAPGLNVLTGETGAGKTVLAHALDLLLGGRGSAPGRRGTAPAGRGRPSMVRPGAAEAYVEGLFDLTPALCERLGDRLPADADELVLARRVGADGRTRAYLNGRSATVAELSDVGSTLLAFYGQHEHRKLLLSAAQLEILDDFCGAPQTVRLRDCAHAHAQARAAAARVEELRELAGARERELDLLEYELAEIDALAPCEGEHEQLLGARERLRRLDALRGAAGAGADALAGDSPDAPAVAQVLARAAAGLEALSGLDPRLDVLAERMRALDIESGDLAGELRDYCEGSLAEEPGGIVGALAGREISLDAVEERLAAIERVARKHGGSVPAVLRFAEQARERRRQLIDVGETLERSGEELRAAEAALDEHVLALRSARRSAAPRLARAVREQLAALAMGEGSFEVALAEDQAGPRGGDAVELLIAPNPGVPAAPLRDIASGGELSRVMLAILTVARAFSEATLVFDEVDAGVGGHTARAVGARLQALGETRQVLCITHLPQIASLGQRHFSIVKDTRAEPTRTSVMQLDERQVLAELVRMLGADSADTAARRHARDLRRAA
jgi:DNA repair protein RecN (Recombination protein N)